jgi:hypothetical protein
MDREIQNLARAKRISRKYGSVELEELVEARLRETKRKKRQLIRKVQNYHKIAA